MKASQRETRSAGKRGEQLSKGLRGKAEGEGGKNGRRDASRVNHPPKGKETKRKAGQGHLMSRIMKRDSRHGEDKGDFV